MRPRLAEHRKVQLDQVQRSATRAGFGLQRVQNIDVALSYEREVDVRASLKVAGELSISACLLGK
jgi:hypothetical protein